MMKQDKCHYLCVWSQDMKILTQILKIFSKFWDNLKMNMEIKEKAEVNWRLTMGLES